MDGSAVKGDLELNDSDAGIRESSSMMSRIYVEGYDTSLSGYDLVEGLREHFASCGEVIHVRIPGYVEGLVTRILNRFALVYLRGEGAEEKALKLSGSYMGGRKVVAKPYPFQATDLDPVLSPMREKDNMRQLTMVVTGYVTSLPLHYVQSMLFEHFSKCGRVLSARASIDGSEGLLHSLALVTVQGEATVERALKLCGCGVKGFENIQVTRVAPPKKHSLSFVVAPWMRRPKRTGGFMFPPDMQKKMMKREEMMTKREEEMMTKRGEE